MEKKPCLFPKCKAKTKSRGLCANHYQAAAHLVRRKKTTWVKYEKAGKCLPTSRGVVTAWFLEDK